MAATWKLSTFSPYRRTSLAFVVTAIVAGLRRIARAFRNRRDAGMLARLDDRMLADIGITRSDLRDAYAEPLWRDPTDILAGRARERRKNRPKSAYGSGPAAPPLVPETRYRLPRTDRTARHHL